MIIIIDFGGQTAHLIGRRLKDLGIGVEIINPKNSLKKIAEKGPSGIIFSGGPSSVYWKGAPSINKKIFELNLPILGICYGWQLAAHLLNGKVEPSIKEFGPVELTIDSFSDLFYGLPQKIRVFESHGDSVTKLPAGFSVIATTETVRNAAVAHPEKRFFGVQFHPEMHHTEHGKDILKNFATRICNEAVRTTKLPINELIAEIRTKVGKKHVIGAFSGGTDSAVA